MKHAPTNCGVPPVVLAAVSGGVLLPWATPGYNDTTMRRNLRLSPALFLLGPFLLFFAHRLPAERVQDLPNPANYVSDFAGVLSPDTQQRLNALCAEVDHQAHAQIAVVTIKSLDGDSIEDFATALEEKWKVGPKGSDRGVLLILAVKDRAYRIEVGYGLEGILPDGRAGGIGRQMIPYLRQGAYDQAVTMAVGQIAQIIAADARINLNTTAPRGPPPPQSRPLTFGQLIGLGVLLFLLVVFLMRAGGSGLLGFLIGTFLGGRWGGGGPGGGGDSGDGGGGFGGFGGGSSGGGGASGDW